MAKQTLVDSKVYGYGETTGRWWVTDISGRVIRDSTIGQNLRQSRTREANTGGKGGLTQGVY